MKGGCGYCAMKNADYWKKRFEIFEEAQNREAARTLNDLNHQFEVAQRTINDQINAWYGRFATNNQISLAEARQWLTGKDLFEFKWDVNEYIEYGKKFGSSPIWQKRLENASARFHISRLEALKIQTQNTMERLYGNQTDVIDGLMKRTYLEGYYHTAFEVQRGVGVGWDIAGLNERQIESVLSRPWTVDQSTFSDKIWAQKQRLIDEVHTQLTQNMILGKAPDDAIKAIAAKFNTSKANAGRLVMTESAYFTNLAEKNAYQDLGVEWTEILGTLDRVTCPLCGSMDGEKIKVSDLKAGMSAPPFHPWCRCTTVPYFADDTGERIARDAKGKNYTVPQDMKYGDWKKTFVDGGSKDDLKGADKNGIVKLPVNKSCEVYQKFGEEHYNGLHALAENAPQLERGIWEKFETDLKVRSATSRAHPNCMNINGIEIDIANDAKGSTWSKPYQTAFHEFGHNIDYIANVQYGNGYFYQPYSYTYKNNLFGDTIRKEVNGRVDGIAAKMKAEFKAHSKDYEWLNKNGYISDWNYTFYRDHGKWIGGEPKFSKPMAYKALEKEIKALTPLEKADISDIFEGATNDKIHVGFGHGKSYWKRETALSAEAFAEMFDSTMACPESLETIKRYLPESYKVFQEMLEAIMKG